MGRADGEGLDPRDLLDLLRRRAWILVLCVLAFPTATYFYSRQLDDVYEAGALIAARPTAADVASLASGDLVGPSAQTDAATARLAMTSAVAEEAARRLNQPPGSVGLTSTSVDEETGFITLTARASTSERAVRIANAFADALDVTRQRRGDRRISEAVGSLLEERAAQGDPDRRAELLDQIRRLRTLRTAQAKNLQVIEPAAIGVKVSPDVERNTIVGGILGLLVGLGLMGVAERLDRRIRKPEELQEISGVPLLATVPRDAFPDGDPSPQLAEAFQTLRDSLTYFNVDRRLTSVLVLSPLKGDGKTTVATNLAVALARTGRHVALVDADLRNPQVATRLGVEPSPGLSDVLAGAPLATAWHWPNGAEHGPLRVLPAGQPPPNPSELLGSRRMSEVLTEIGAICDIVVLDTAPVLVVSDAFPLFDQVSGIVAIANLRQTPRDAVRRMLDIVATAGRGRVLGMVATGASRAPRYGYGYGYGPYVAPDTTSAPVAGAEPPTVSGDPRVL